MKREKIEMEWSDRDFARARPASEVLPPEAAAVLMGSRGRGRPVLPSGERKQTVTMRLSPDVLAALKATGPGWQTRAENALRQAFVLGRRS